MDRYALREVTDLQSLKGIPFPAGVSFRQLVVTGPPGVGKSTLLDALGGAVGARRPSHEARALELLAYAFGELTLLADIAKPTVGVVTNVFPVHLERMGTIERIAQSKGELVEAILAGEASEAQIATLEPPARR